MEMMLLHLTTKIQNFLPSRNTQRLLRAMEYDEQIPVSQRKDETCRETAVAERIEINVKK